ncbi:hypothetical protein [Nocardia sp. NPDC005825]|uniref:hypothetical protein n=1 Tax=unclassified Nocardia TaxID=2637762 RepID=UPI0034058EAA
MFATAFLQYSGKGPMRHEEMLLELGLKRCGIPVQYYTIKRIHRRQLPLGPDVFIAGDMDAMHGAMRQLAIPVPEPDDYPASLTEFLRRRVWTATLGEVERAFDSGSLPPTFIKPGDKRKSFTGTVCYSERDDRAWRGALLRSNWRFSPRGSNPCGTPGRTAVTGTAGPEETYARLDHSARRACRHGFAVTDLAVGPERRGCRSWRRKWRGF